MAESNENEMMKYGWGGRQSKKFMIYGECTSLKNYPEIFYEFIYIVAYVLLFVFARSCDI